MSKLLLFTILFGILVSPVCCWQWGEVFSTITAGVSTVSEQLNKLTQFANAWNPSALTTVRDVSFAVNKLSKTSNLVYVHDVLKEVANELYASAEHLPIGEKYAPLVSSHLNNIRSIAMEVENLQRVTVDAIFTEKYMINQMQEDIPQIVNHLKENKVTKAKFLIEGLETRLGEFVTEVKQLRERYTAQQQRLKEESRRVDNTNKMIQQKRKEHDSAMSGNVVIGIGGILLAPVTGGLSLLATAGGVSGYLSEKQLKDEAAQCNVVLDQLAFAIQHVLQLMETRVQSYSEVLAALKAGTMHVSDVKRAVQQFTPEDAMLQVEKLPGTLQNIQNSYNVFLTSLTQSPPANSLQIGKSKISAHQLRN